MLAPFHPSHASCWNSFRTTSSGKALFHLGLTLLANNQPTLQPSIFKNHFPPSRHFSGQRHAALPPHCMSSPGWWSWGTCPQLSQSDCHSAAWYYRPTCCQQPVPHCVAQMTGGLFLWLLSKCRARCCFPCRDMSLLKIKKHVVIHTLWQN